MRPLFEALLIVVLSLLLASPASASCRPPAPLVENAARATEVVYGVVTEVSGGAVTLRVDRVLKGQVDATIRAFVGPGRPGTGGTGVITSTDYTAAVGSDHVLYVMRAADGQFETNACIGSHAGPPDAAELAYFGAGTSPSGGSTTPAPVRVPEAPVPVAQVSPILSALILAVVAGATIFVLRRRAV